MVGPEQGGLPAIQGWRVVTRQGVGEADGRLGKPRSHVGTVVKKNKDGKYQGLAQECRLHPESHPGRVGAGPRCRMCFVQFFFLL